MAITNTHAAQLNHPNVAQVFDIGKLGDSYFFTMEYVHGETVRNLLHRARSLRREIPLSCILTVIAGAATGLHHAHDRIGFDGRPLGIVHRDVSPSNLMISYEGSVKVVDFGVAKADNRAQETRSAAVKGKISYLSPEQIGGAAVDRRSDLFALGIVLWEMLTTERLYRRASDFENMNAIVNEPPQVPSQWRTNLPREIDEMSIRLLSKRREERYQSGDELVEAIEALASRVGAQLSSAALGRFMRELFGQRPEPWHEVEIRDAPPEGVTVTNEPVAPELAALDPIELDLARVRDLSRQFAAVGSQSASANVSPPAPDFDAMEMIDVRPSDGDVRPTVPLQRVNPATARRGPVAVAMPILPTPTPPRNKVFVLVIGAAALFGVFGTIAVLVVTRSSDQPAAAVTGSAGSATATSKPEVAAPAPVASTPEDPAIAPKDLPPPPRPPAAPTHGERITTAYRGARYDEVSALCRVSVGDRAHLCVLAACQRADAVRARAWLARVAASKRAAVQSECKDAGVDLAPPKPKPGKPDAAKDCLTNPMACQH
ncbi:MAG: protein kinase [Deltaproteobacteria bacterium]|nr:protein kinase [Deltaproteobacteria bacterium]